jgi:ABC-2 type transport system permease protein
VTATAVEAHPALVPQVLVLSRRAIIGFFRQPSAWVFGSLFPLLIAAVSASAFSRATNLEGFPDAESFLQFLLPGTIIQGVLFGSITGSTDLALDIENGFFDRLLASPVARPVILVSRLAGSAVYGALVTVAYVAVFWAFGAGVRGGPAGVAVMVLLSMVMAVAVGGFGAALGLRTGSAEAVGNSFPLFFVLLFVSSAFFPVALMSGWYRRVAELNPVTHVIDAARHQVLVGFSLAEAAVGLAIAVAFATLTIGFAVTQLRRRLRSAS